MSRFGDPPTTGSGDEPADRLRSPNRPSPNMERMLPEGFGGSQLRARFCRISSYTREFLLKLMSFRSLCAEREAERVVPEAPLRLQSPRLQTHRFLLRRCVAHPKMQDH